MTREKKTIDGWEDGVWKRRPKGRNHPYQAVSAVGGEKKKIGNAKDIKLAFGALAWSGQQRDIGSLTRGAFGLLGPESPVTGIGT